MEGLCCPGYSLAMALTMTPACIETTLTKLTECSCQQWSAESTAILAL